MSYPATEYWKVFETAEVVLAGGATFIETAELAQVIVTMYKHGVAAGTETMRVKLYHDAALTKLYATGEWTDLIGGHAGATYWRGRIPLNFAVGSYPFVQPGQEYFVAIETASYTRNGETFFVSLGFDWPLTINDNASALAMAFMIVDEVAY